MLHNALLLALAFVFLSCVVSVPLQTERAATGKCSSYTIIDTRGTMEFQGPSIGFLVINPRIKHQVPGGTEYYPVYPASPDQNSTLGTLDIVNKVHSTLQSNPDTCFFLEGYSQGAAATVNALPKLTGDAFEAVRGVFLIGDPFHKSGLSCNVDNYGGTSSRDVNGESQVSPDSPSIPSEWQSKTLDVCIFGDGVCDTSHGKGINAQHLQYPVDKPTHTLGVDFAVAVLNGHPFPHE